MLCPYCRGAKQLLDKKNVAYEEIAVDGKPEERARMRERAGGSSSVPQNCVGDQHIGGGDELYSLDSEGRLDQLLAA